MRKIRINRRDWMKSGTLMAGGLFLGGVPKIKAAPKSGKIVNYKRELSELDRERPVLKARLLANENPFGPSPKAKEAIQNTISQSFRYPFFEFDTFREMIAEEEGVKPENILLSAGSTEILIAAAIAYGQGRGKILSADITYMDLLDMAERNGSELDLVPLTEDLDFDLEAMKEKVSKDHSLVYIVNPNNPTGKSLDPDKLKAFCTEVASNKPVFIDEAYIDFKDDVKRNSMIYCVKEGKNVIVTRTFSKLHAFAGLRIGYAIALPETVEKLGTFCSEGRTISYPSINAAMASYQDKEFLEYSKKEIIKSRQFFYDTLDKAGYEYIKSDANFVLFPLKYMKASRFVEEMFKMQVGVREWSFRGKEWSRVSMGTMEEMKIFADAFEKLS